MLDDLLRYATRLACDFQRVQVNGGVERMIIEYVRSLRPARGSVEWHEIRCDEREIDCGMWSKLCFKCFIQEHGTDALADLVKGGWTDEPMEQPDWSWTNDEVLDWEASQAKQREWMRLRELAYHLRDVDMFDSIETPKA